MYRNECSLKYDALYMLRIMQKRLLKLFLRNANTFLAAQFFEYDTNF